MVKPNVRPTSIGNNLYVKKSLHVDGAYLGIKPQYQRAEVPPGGDCETVGDFTEETSGALDITAVGSGKVGSNSIRLTQTSTVVGKSVYLQFAGPKDLMWAKFLGIWYKGKNATAYAAGDLRVYLFTKKGNVLYAARTLHYNFPSYTEEATAVWHYLEIPIASMTVASGKEGEANLREVWGIGFYSNNLAQLETMDIDHIEAYTHGTGYGPARGTIVTSPITDGVTVARGNTLKWVAGSGRVNLSDDNEPYFAGVAVAGGVGNEQGTTYADIIVDGPVNMKASAAISAAEGVCMSAAGATPTIDDGGGGSQDYEIGKALEAAAGANEVITVLLKGFGISTP